MARWSVIANVSNIVSTSYFPCFTCRESFSLSLINCDHVVELRNELVSFFALTPKEKGSLCGYLRFNRHSGYCNNQVLAIVKTVTRLVTNVLQQKRRFSTAIKAARSSMLSMTHGGAKLV